MKNFMQKKLNKKGFTLAELLIVVAIIAVLVGVAVPIFTKKLEKTREETDIANLRSAKAAAVAQYLDDNENAGIYYFDADAGVIVAAGTTPASPISLGIHGYGQGQAKKGGCDAFKLSTDSGDNHYYTEESPVRDRIIKINIQGGSSEDVDYITMSWVTEDLSGTEYMGETVTA